MTSATLHEFFDNAASLLLDKIAAALLPVSAFLVLMRTCFQIFVLGPGTWDEARLASTAAFLKGYALYYGQDPQGPVLNLIYGPLAALVYLPAALMPHPVPAVFAGKILSALMFLVPAFWFCTAAPFGKGRAKTYGLTAFFIFAMTPFQFLIHADAPALCFSALACGFLYFFRDEKDPKPLILSALFSIAAVLTKQAALPLLPALSLYVGITFGRRVLLRYLTALAVCAAAAFVLLHLFLPFEAFTFNFVEMQLHHPLLASYYVKELPPVFDPGPGERLKLLTAAFSGMLSLYYPYFAIVIFFVLKEFFLSPPSKLSRKPWLVLVITGAAMLPFALLSRIRQGGADNAFYFVAYFAVLAAVIFLRNGTAAREENSGSAKLILLVFLWVLFAVRLPVEGYQFYKAWGSAESSGIHNYARRHPGELYFPWNPLRTLYTDGKLYPFSYGLTDRELAGFPVSEESFRKYLPANLREVIFCKAQDEYVMKYLKEFSQIKEQSELPGCRIYVRPS
jgi:hypothetical protein